MNATIKIIRKQYRDDTRPWYIGFSGGKDSTALLALVYSALLGIRRLHKPVTVLYCDTGVEIPIVSEYVRRTLNRLHRQVKESGVPIRTRIVKPHLSDSFFVKVIGNGYPPPTNKFRWCTNRLRVDPVRRAMQLCSNEQSLMLLGTRWEESPERTRTLARFQLNGDHYFKQAGNTNTTIFAPLVNFSTKQIWDILHSNGIPACLHIPELITLYRSATGSMCSGRCLDCSKCTSNRFGCWICTVVRKDRAVTNMVSNGYPELAPLLAFRNWLVSIRDKPYLRHKKRCNGSEGPGPFTMYARRMVLSQLMKAEQATSWQLLSPAEKSYIKHVWKHDAC